MSKCCQRKKVKKSLLYILYSFNNCKRFQISPSPPKKIGITLRDTYLFLTEKAYDAELRKLTLATICQERAQSRNRRPCTAFPRTLEFVNLSFSAKQKPQFRYKGIAFFVFMWYNNIIIISCDERRILYGKTIFMDNEHRRKHTVLS